MAHRYLLTIFVLIAALAAGAVLYLTRDLGVTADDAGAGVLGPGVELSTAPVNDGEASDLQAPSTPAPEALTAAPRKVARADLVPESQPGQPAVPSNVVWVQGRIVFPPNTPEDEHILVLGHGKRFPGRKKSKGVHQAEVQENGEFRVAFMPNTKRARLTLRARYCYLPSSLRFVMDELPDELVVEPLLGGRIAGLMTLPEPLEGEDPDHRKVLIEVDNWNGGEFVNRVATTAEDGSWEVNGLPPNAGYQVESRSVAFTQMAEGEVSVTEGETVQLDTTATRGVTLRGVVVDAGGQPVEGAEVEADTDGRFRSKEDRTDEQGQFVITGITPGDIDIEARHKDFLEAQVEVEGTVEGDVRTGLRLVFEGGGVIEGLVQWPDGTPAVRATVRVDQQQGENWRYRSDRDNNVRTGEDGSFRFSGLGIEPCTLQADARPPKDLAEAMTGSRSRTRWRVLREEVVPDGGRIVLVLEEARALVGRIVDDRGEPVTRFRVTLRQKLEGTWTGQSYAKVFSDENGEFEFTGIAPGSWSIAAKVLAESQARVARGVYFYSDDERIVQVPQTEDLVLRIARPARLTGTVLDPSGNPQSGAEVYVSAGNRRSREGITDSDGGFELTDVEPGGLVITARHERFANSTKMVLGVEPASEHEGLVLTLRKGGVIKGEVSPAAGEVAQRSITVMGQSGSGWKRGESDDNGRFEIEGLTGGTYRVQLEEASTSTSSSELVAAIPSHRHPEVVEVVEGQTVHVVLGAGPDDPIAIRGRVTSAGEPVPGVRVSAQLQGGEDPPYTGRSDASGAYEVVVDGPGSYRFLLTRDPGTQLQEVVEVPAGAVLARNFELPTAHLAGIVHGPAGPAPDVPMRLTWTGKEGRGATTLSVRTGDDGRYTFEHLEPGSYSLRAGGLVRTTSSTEFGLVPETRSVELSASGATGVDFRPRPGGAIAGHVVGEYGAKKSGHQLQASIDGGKSWTYIGYARTDRPVRAAGFERGTVLVRIRRGSEGTTPVEVRVAAGTVTTFEISE